VQGAFKYHQYQVVGRHLPTEHNENPELYRMKLWASDTVAAKSKFWCFASSAAPPPPLPSRGPSPLPLLRGAWPASSPRNCSFHSDTCHHLPVM